MNALVPAEEVSGAPKTQISLVRIWEELVKLAFLFEAVLKSGSILMGKSSDADHSF